MARTLLSFQPDNQDERLRQLLDGGSAPLADTPAAPPAPDDVPQQDQGADTVATQPQSDPTPQAQPMAASPSPAPTPPPSREDQILQMLLGRQEQKDPALEARWKQAETNALDRADYLQNANQHYGLGEFTRDNGAALVASILDVGFNKGRGLGGIVGATAQGVGQQEAARLAQAQQAREFALKVHQDRGQHQPDPVSQMLALDRLGVSHQNADTSGRRVQGTEDWRKQLSNPDSAYQQTRVTQAGRTRTASEQALLDTQHQNNPRTATDKANISGAEAAAATGARINTELGYAPQTNAAAAQKELGVSGAKVEGTRAAESANRPVPPGFVNVNDAAFANANQDQATRTKMLGDTMSARQLQMAADRIAALRAKNGPQWLPSQDSGEYQALHLAVVGAANRAVADAGTLNQGERQMIEKLVPGAEPNWKDLAGWVSGSDLNADQLMGFAKGLNQVLGARVASYGLAPDSGPQPLPQPGSVPGQQPRAPRPYAPAQPGELGGQQPVAPPATSRSGGGKVRVRMKTKAGWDEADVESDLLPYLPKGVQVVP